MTEREKERISERILQAKKCRDLREAFVMFHDLTESGGMGIITMILMLRSLGINDSRFVFVPLPEEKETLTQLSIPLSAMTEQQMEEVSKTITDEVTSIPKFPEAILEVQKLVSNPDISFQD